VSGARASGRRAWRVALPRVELVACHRLPERSFAWRGRQFPVCARCTGILLGWATYPLFLLGLAVLPLWLALALNVPALADGLTQATGRRTSTNALRLATGLLAGLGQVGATTWAGAAAARLVLALL
jgi:uncharacterized membrane protein